MRPVKSQFFLSFAVIGSLMPLLPVFLKGEKGLSEFEIGLVFALHSLAAIVSPAWITLLADLKVDSRRILAVLYGICGGSLVGVALAPGPGATIAFFALNSLAFAGLMPLQDGFYFSVHQDRIAAGQTSADYPLVRVWGTVGFIVPSLVLFSLIEAGSPAGAILFCALGCCVLGAGNTLALPALRSGGPAVAEAGNTSADSGGGDPPLTTARPSGRRISWEAAAKLFGPEARVLCLALFLAFGATSVYYGFFPLYLEEVIGVPRSWIGLIINLGVVIEIFFILSMRRLEARLGLKWIVFLGFAGMALRLGLLAQFPGVATALLVQVVHGFEILAVYVVPVVYLNRIASDHFRNSIQGLYTMVVLGVSRVGGSLVAGHLAGIDLVLLFRYGAFLGLAAAAIILFWRER